MTSKVLHLPRLGSRGECVPQEGGATIIPINRVRLVRPVLGRGPVAKWEADPDNGNTLISPGWLDLFGADNMELGRKGFLHTIHPDGRFAAAMRWLEGRRKGVPYHSLNLTWVHGVYRPVLTLAFPIRDRSGQIVRWEGYCQLLEEDKAVNF